MTETRGDRIQRRLVNTHEHHEATVQGADRAERNMLKTVTGEFGKFDRATMTTLQGVLA